MAHFHGSYKKVCDNHDPEFYPKFKAWADRYFVIQHRNETRGLGGIFFDDLNDRDPDTIFEFSKEVRKRKRARQAAEGESLKAAVESESKRRCINAVLPDQTTQDTLLPRPILPPSSPLTPPPPLLLSQALNSVVDAYCPIVTKHKDDPYTEENRQWQQLRRGRYVEFNLVYDRGTVFGLKTGGRIESILMSLPETARWEYCQEPEEGSPEWRLLDACKYAREWI